jgi:hypothetical protein
MDEEEKFRKLNRMEEMLQPIDGTIMMTDEENDLIMLACAMQIRAKELFDALLGEENRKKLFIIHT